MRPAGTEKEVGGAVKREKEEEGEGKEEEEEESLLMAALERMDLECLVGLLCEEGGPGLRKDTTDAPDKEQEEKRSGSLEGAGGMEGGTLSGGTYSQEVRGTEREREREGRREERGEGGGGRGEGGGGRGEGGGGRGEGGGGRGEEDERMVVLYRIAELFEVEGTNNHFL